MHKKILLAILVIVIGVLLFSCSDAQAQQVYTVLRNDDSSTTLQSNNLGNSKISTDSKGRQYAMIPSTTGGYDSYTFGGLVGTVQTVKGTAGTLGGYHIFNPAATVCYLQLFYVASATTVTLGTTVPNKSLGFPAGAAANIPAVSPGTAFPLGLKIAATTTRAGSTPCGTGMDVNIDYK